MAPQHCNPLFRYCEAPAKTSTGTPINVIIRVVNPFRLLVAVIGREPATDPETESGCFGGTFVMTYSTCNRFFYLFCCALSCSCFLARPLRAEIVGRQARVETRVQELVSGLPASLTEGSDQLAADGSNLPLNAQANLLSTDLEGNLVAMAQGQSEFLEPLVNQSNPAEFTLEVACFSNAEGVSYEVTGSATEDRTVLFPLGAQTNGFDFDASGTQTVESRFFLNGAVVFWSTEPDRDLSGMQADISVTVRRGDTGAVLFETTFRVEGQPASSTRLIAGGPIQFESLSANELGAEGIVGESLAILQRTATQGTLVVVVIPPQEHPYLYTVSADVPLVLTAELTAHVQNAPEGTGVAVTLGGPFENLAQFIDQGLPGVDGGATERSINAATATRAIGLVPQSGPSAQTRLSPCGFFGLESLGFAGLAAFYMALARCVPRRRACR